MQRHTLFIGELARGEIRYGYDDAGNRTSVTDQRGAKTTWAYDDLNRVRTETKVVRKAGAPDDLFTTTFDYDDLGNQNFVDGPSGETTTRTFNPASEMTSETDPLSKVTTFTYELAGRLVRRTDPLGRYTENTYDLAGRITSTNDYSATGTLLRTTSYAYDAAGNQTEVTPPRGFTTNLSYDAASRLKTVTEPVSATSSITTSYGYDASGNLTRFTDGEGRVFVLTYQSWGLQESVIEPSTTAHPAASDRTFTSIYDSAGLPIEERQPGGVSIQRTFDELGRLKTESGSGGGAASAAKTFGYDLSGLRTSASHPSGAQSFTYDDRGLLTSSTGPAGNASYSYDSSGRLTSRTDPAGANSFTWTAGGELSSASDPLTGVTRSHTFDDASQLTEVSYGSGSSPKLELSWDDLGRLTADTLKDPSGATKAGYTYSYDADSNLTSQAINLPGNSLSGTHAYSYDRAGRLSSWTKPDGSTGSYTWDKAGNRLTAGPATFAYDERNRLSVSTEPAVSLLGSVTITRNFSYTPTGTLKEVTDGATTQRYTFDALGRQTAYDDGLAPAGFTYDSLDRIAQRSQGITASSFTYSGFDIDPAQDGSFTYARSPGGRLLSMKKGSDAFLAGMNRHGDLTYLFETDADLTDTRVYDPFGKLMEKTGLTDPNLGFQGDFTDPTSGKVWMGSRWFSPNEDTFLSRDTVFGQLNDPISLNRFTYAQGNPLMYMDPDGQAVCFIHGWANCKREAKKLKKRVGKAFADAGAEILTGAAYQPRAEIKTATAEQKKTKQIQSQRKQSRDDSKQKQAAAAREKVRKMFNAPCGVGLNPAEEDNTVSSRCNVLAQLQKNSLTQSCTALGCIQLPNRNIVKSEGSEGGGGGKGKKVDKKTLDAAEANVRNKVRGLDDETVEQVREAVERSQTGKVRFEKHDGSVFRNTAKDLPNKKPGYYTEWSAAAEGAKRGKHRVIVGGRPEKPDVIYYWDHTNKPVKIYP